MLASTPAVVCVKFCKMGWGSPFVLLVWCFSLRGLSQQLLFVFAQQIHVQVARSLDPVLVRLDSKRSDQP